MWTYNQAGDDYWGRPPSRFAYKAWTFKRQIENLLLLGVDRFGAGTPVLEGGPDWADADFTRALEFLKNWRAGSDTALTYPSGGKLELAAAKSDVFTAMLEIVKHFNLGIAKTWLTQGTELGSTETGSRALGETFTEQAAGVVQADDEAIASVINEGLIKNLIDWNFGPQESYPMFTPSQRVRETTVIAQFLDSLIKNKAIHWTPEDEAWIRDNIGAPERDLAELQVEFDKDQAAADAAAQALLQPADPTGDPNTGGGKARAAGAGAGTPGGKGAGLGRDRRAVRALALASDMPTGGRTADYIAWEHGIVKPDVLTRDLDLQTARLTGEVQSVLHEIDRVLQEQVAVLARGGPEAIAAELVAIVVGQTLRQKLRAVMLEAAARARTYGAQAVANEVDRQAQPDVAAPARLTHDMRQARALFRLPDKPEGVVNLDERARDMLLRAEVERAVADEITRRETAARAAAIAAIAAAGAQPIDELVQVARARARGALEDLSTQRTDANVGAVVNVGFGIGRRDGGDAARAKEPDGFAEKVYSAVLDEGTCAECARWDGGHYPIDYSETDPGNVKAPNPNCAGGYSRCRCIWLYLRADETPWVVGPTKGPAQEAA
jgi:hypothetical protein